MSQVIVVLGSNNNSVSKKRAAKAAKCFFDTNYEFYDEVLGKRKVGTYILLADGCSSVKNELLSLGVKDKFIVDETLCMDARQNLNMILDKMYPYNICFKPKIIDVNCVDNIMPNR